MFHRPGYRWVPEHSIDGNRQFAVYGVESEECPVSAIKPEAAELVQIFNRARHGKENSGAALFGPDLAKWPSRMVDVAVVIEQETIREHNARIDADRN